MPDAWFLQLKTVRGDFFKQESLFQKARTVSSLSLKQRTVEQAPHNGFSCLWSGVMSTLLNKKHSGRKPRQWTPDCPHCKMTSSLMGFVVDQSNQLCPTPTPTWCEWQLPQVAFPTGSKSETEPDALHCICHHPCCLWAPRLSWFPTEMCPQLPILKSPP